MQTKSSLVFAREKKIMAAVLILTAVSSLVVPIMTEISYLIGTYGSAEHMPAADLLLLISYTHFVTYYDMLYLAGWYVGYSLYLPNLSYDLAHSLNGSTETPFSFIFGSSVFGYLEAPPWDAIYVIPAMYLPLLAIIPSWLLSKPLPLWRRVLYTYLVVTQVSVFLRLLLVTIL